MDTAGMRIVNGIEVCYYRETNYGEANYWHLMTVGAKTTFDCALYTLAEALESFTNGK